MDHFWQWSLIKTTIFCVWQNQYTTNGKFAPDKKKSTLMTMFIDIHDNGFTPAKEEVPSTSAEDNGNT